MVDQGWNERSTWTQQQNQGSGTCSTVPSLTATGPLYSALRCVRYSSTLLARRCSRDAAQRYGAVNALAPRTREGVALLRAERLPSMALRGRAFWAPSSRVQRGLEHDGRELT